MEIQLQMYFLIRKKIWYISATTVASIKIYLLKIRKKKKNNSISAGILWINIITETRKLVAG